MKPEEYQFISSTDNGVAELLEELDREKEHFKEPSIFDNMDTGTGTNYGEPEKEPDIPEEENIYNDDPEPEKETELSDYEKQQRSNQAAKFMVSTIDGLMSGMLSFFALDEESKKYSADTEEKEYLQTYWQEYLKDKGGNIPPGLQVLGATLVVYGMKTKLAADNRKLQKELQEKQKELDTYKQIIEKENIRRESSGEGKTININKDNIKTPPEG